MNAPRHADATLTNKHATGHELSQSSEQPTSSTERYTLSMSQQACLAVKVHPTCAMVRTGFVFRYEEQLFYERQ